MVQQGSSRLEVGLVRVPPPYLWLVAGLSASNFCWSPRNLVKSISNAHKHTQTIYLPFGDMERCCSPVSVVLGEARPA